MMRMMTPVAMAAAEGEDRSRSGWRQYLDALEEERRKIQVFQRELPLCLELVTQTIESYRQQMQIMSCGGTERSETEHHRPRAVLEEFIPMKCADASQSSSHEAERDNLRIVPRSTDGEEMGACNIVQQKIGRDEEVGSDNGLMPTADWLNLAHLWHCTTGNNLKEVCLQDPPPYQEQHQTTPTKPIVVEARRPTGAFQPFCRSKPATVTTAPAVPDEVAAPPIVVPPPPPPPPVEESPQQPAAVAESSTTDAGRGGEGSGPATTAESSGHASGTGEQELKKKVEVCHTQSSSGTSSNHRKSRRCWSPELHRRFLKALQQLGGSHAATPKQIRELMKVDGLTNDEVKSHLQKYRLHTRRPTPAVAPVSAATPHAAPHFVLVSGIWLPPPEYTVAAAAVAASQPAPAPDGRHSGVPTTDSSASTKPPSQPVQGCQKQVGRPAAASTPVRSAPQPHDKASTCDDADKGVDNSSSQAASSTSSRTGTTASPSAR